MASNMAAILGLCRVRSRYLRTPRLRAHARGPWFQSDTEGLGSLLPWLCSLFCIRAGKKIICFNGSRKGSLVGVWEYLGVEFSA